MNDILANLEFAQTCWVVPDIEATINFFKTNLGIVSFPQPNKMSAIELGMTYRGKMEEGQWLTSQTYNGNSFLELVQPISGNNMFQDYLTKNPTGGIQHVAFRTSISELEKVVRNLEQQGLESISEVDHPIARMVFFDTYQQLGHALEIMGVTPDGWAAIRQMQAAK